MRVLLVHNRYQHAGGEDVVFNAELDLLRHHGHDVMEYREDNRELGTDSKTQIAVKSIWSHDSQRRISKLLQSQTCDIAHFHNTWFRISPAVYYTCRRMRVPVVQTLHNFRLLCPAATFYRKDQVCEKCLNRTLPWPGMVHACYRQSHVQSAVISTMLAIHRVFGTWKSQVNQYIALTQFAREKFKGGGIPEKKISVKPNFIRVDPGRKAELGDYALFIGRLVPEKGVRTMMHAWQNISEIPLKIAGTGPLFDEMQAYTDERGLKSIEFLGQQPHDRVISLMKRARVLVFPSVWYEGFPMTIVEAFACGLVVISSRLGSMEEIIDDQRTGLHFSPGDSDDLATKIDWAWRHPERLTEIGKGARLEYEAKFTNATNYKILIDIYNKAINDNQSTVNNLI